MCGIVGYTGTQDAIEPLLLGLRRLEYRGYDSAGLAALVDGEIQTRRTVGRVERLQAALHSDPITSSTAIAHTRWATHGPPTVANAHPHQSQTGRFAIVHNGIIENHAALRTYLSAFDIQFQSDTDTEVLAQLIGLMAEKTDDVVEAVRLALRECIGTFGLAVLCTDEPGTIVAARRGSPLAIGVGADGCWVASDPSALIAHAQQVSYLEDDEIVRLEPTGIHVCTMDAVRVEKHMTDLDLTLEAIELNGYEHHMLKEINEQPQSLRDTLRGRIDLRTGELTLGGLLNWDRELPRYKQAILFGCGTAWHAGLIGKHLFEELARIPTQVDYASELRYRNPVVEPGTFAVAVSQSGETADTLAALRELKLRGADVFGIVNVVGSTIARETDAGIYLHAGPEIGVASTKAFTSQIAVFAMMAITLGRRRCLPIEQCSELIKELHEIPGKVAEALELDGQIREIVDLLIDCDHWLYLGRGINYPLALEGALQAERNQLYPCGRIAGGGVETWPARFGGFRDSRGGNRDRRPDLRQDDLQHRRSSQPGRPGHCHCDGREYRIGILGGASALRSADPAAALSDCQQHPVATLGLSHRLRAALMWTGRATSPNP